METHLRVFVLQVLFAPYSINLGQIPEKFVSAVSA